MSSSTQSNYDQCILVSGVTGALGRILLPLLAGKEFSNYQFIFMVRRTLPFIIEYPSDRFIFSLSDAASSISWMNHIQTYSPNRVVILSNIRHFSSFRSALNELSLDSIPLLLIGTTGVYSRFNNYSSPYSIIENELASYPRNDLLLLRPSLIFGTTDDKNFSSVVRFILKYRFFFVIGSGNNMIQPICYQDLAELISNCLLRPSLYGCFDVTGSHCISSIDFVRQLFLCTKVKPFIIKIPLTLALVVAFISEKSFHSSKFSVERVLRQTEDKCFDHYHASKVLNFHPRNLLQILPEYCALF